MQQAISVLRMHNEYLQGMMDITVNVGADKRYRIPTRNGIRRHDCSSGMFFSSKCVWVAVSEGVVEQTAGAE